MADGIVYVDIAEGVKRVMNNMKLYVKLLSKFRSDNSLDKLNSLLGAGDLSGAQAEAHKIKGVAGNLSLTELHKKSLEIEKQIKSGAVDTAALETLNACFVETIKAVEQVLTENA